MEVRVASLALVAILSGCSTSAIADPPLREAPTPYVVPPGFKGTAGPSEDLGLESWCYTAQKYDIGKPVEQGVRASNVRLRNLGGPLIEIPAVVTPEVQIAGGESVILKPGDTMEEGVTYCLSASDPGTQSNP